MLTLVFWIVLLTAALFWPVSNLIWTFSVRRKQRKLKQDLDEHEIMAQKKRARFLAVIVCFMFSVIFNLSRLGLPTDG